MVNGASDSDGIFVDDVQMVPRPTEACIDGDEDGEADTRDRCQGTASGAAIDDGGCSLPQFGAAFDATSRAGASLCKLADWRNDEPRMKAKDRDCKVEMGGKGSSDDRCVPHQ